MIQLGDKTMMFFVHTLNKNAFLSKYFNTSEHYALWFCVYWGCNFLKLCNHTKHASTLEDPVVLNVQHFDETKAIRSQACEVTQFAEFP